MKIASVFWLMWKRNSLKQSQIWSWMKLKVVKEPEVRKVSEGPGFKSADPEWRSSLKFFVWGSFRKDGSSVNGEQPLCFSGDMTMNELRGHFRTIQRVFIVWLQYTWNSRCSPEDAAAAPLCGFMKLQKEKRKRKKSRVLHCWGRLESGEKVKGQFVSCPSENREGWTTWCSFKASTQRTGTPTELKWLSGEVQSQEKFDQWSKTEERSLNRKCAIIHVKLC